MRCGAVQCSAARLSATGQLRSRSRLRGAGGPRLLRYGAARDAACIGHAEGLFTSYVEHCGQQLRCRRARPFHFQAYRDAPPRASGNHSANVPPLFQARDMPFTLAARRRIAV